MFEPTFNTENPVVRDELWNDNDDYDDDFFYYNGRWYRGDEEPDWDSMPGGHDYFDDY